MTASKQSKNIRIGKTSDAELNEMAEESYRQITRGHSSQPVREHDIICNKVYRRPKPVPDSATLIQMAETEWHNREERRGIHAIVPWTCGWMSGYLTSEGDIVQARKAERERVLNEIIASFDEHGCPFPECTEERYQRFDLCRECIVDWLKSLRGGERE